MKIANKHRYFYICYNFLYTGVIRYGYAFIETQFDKIFSIGDLRQITGVAEAIPVFWKEFEKKEDFLRFQDKDIVNFPVLGENDVWI